MKRLISLPLVLVIGFLSIVAAATLGVLILVFEIADRMLTPMIRKEKHKMESVNKHYL